MKREKRRTKSEKRGGPLPKKAVEYFRQTWMRHGSFPDIVACKDQQDTPPPKYPSDFDKERSLLKASIKVHKGLKELQTHAAAGDRLAMGMLLGHVEELVQWLEDVSYRREAFLQSYARESACWPMLVALRPKRMREIRAHLKRLGVATQSEIRADEKAQWGIARSKGQEGKGYRTSGYATATVYALAARDMIRGERDRMGFAKILSRGKPGLRAIWNRLPKWQRDCATVKPLNQDPDAWAQIGWQALLEKTNDNPSSIPELKHIGDHRAAKYARHYKKNVVSNPRKREILTRTKSPDRTATYHINEGIKERFFDAVRHLARKQ